VLAFFYAFLIIFVIVDVTVNTKNYYNMVSLSGIFVYLAIMFFFSVAPAKVTAFVRRLSINQETNISINK